MRIKYLLRTILPALFVFSFLASQGQAGTPTEQIRATTDKILEILKDPALEGPEKEAERRRRVREAVDECFDWEEISRRALGRHWRKRSESERREFIDLFGDLVERTYMDRVANYSGERVEFLGENIEGNYGVVSVRILTLKNEDISLEYRVRKKGNDWFVYDVTVEGVSLVNNYRVQFNSIIMKSSYEDLRRRLREKVVRDV